MPSLLASRASRLLLPAALAAATLALVACDLVASVGTRQWTMSAEGQAGTRTVSVTDASGKVLDVAFDPVDAELFAPASVPAGQPNALDVTWTGGACDTVTDVAISASGVGLAITVAITPDEELVCDAFGEPRVLRLFLAGPIAPAAVTVTQQAAAS
jgi:hypothetical protein